MILVFQPFQRKRETVADVLSKPHAHQVSGTLAFKCIDKYNSELILQKRT